MNRNYFSQFHNDMLFSNEKVVQYLYIITAYMHMEFSFYKCHLIFFKCKICYFPAKFEAAMGKKNKNSYSEKM